MFIFSILKNREQSELSDRKITNHNRNVSEDYDGIG